MKEIGTATIRDGKVADLDTVDPVGREIEAIETCVRALADLDRRDAERVIRYVADRYDLRVNTAPVPLTTGGGLVIGQAS